MTLDQLRHFLLCSRLEHVGKAATAAHVSPSAVSRSVSLLEDELGPLFERTGRRIFLNARGRRLREECSKILEAVESLPSRISGKDSAALRGHWKVSASHALSTRWLAPLIAHFIQTHDDLSIEVSAENTLEVIGDVLSGRADCGICFSPQRHPQLFSVELWKGTQKIMVRRGHPLLKYQGAARLRALSEYPVILHRVSARHDIEPYILSLTKAGIRTEPRAYFDHGDIATAIIVQSDCWSVLPEFLSGPNVIAIEEPPGWKSPLSVALVTRVGREREPFVQAILDNLRTSTPTSRQQKFR